MCAVIRFWWHLTLIFHLRPGKSWKVWEFIWSWKVWEFIWSGKVGEFCWWSGENDVYRPSCMTVVYFCREKWKYTFSVWYTKMTMERSQRSGGGAHGKSEISFFTLNGNPDRDASCTVWCVQKPATIARWACFFRIHASNIQSTQWWYQVAGLKQPVLGQLQQNSTRF